MILAIILSIVIVNGHPNRNLRKLNENSSFDIQIDASNSLQEVEQENPPKQEFTPYKMTIIEMYTMDVTKLPQFQNIKTQQNFIEEDEFLIRQDSITHNLKQLQ